MFAWAGGRIRALGEKCQAVGSVMQIQSKVKPISQKIGMFIWDFIFYEGRMMK